MYVGYNKYNANPGHIRTYQARVAPLNQTFEIKKNIYAKTNLQLMPVLIT